MGSAIRFWLERCYGSESGSSDGRNMRVRFGKARSTGGLPDLDRAYQQQLAALSRVRRAVAAAAIARKQLELQLGQMTEQEAGDHLEMPRPDEDLRLEPLRRLYTAVNATPYRFHDHISDKSSRRSHRTWRVLLAASWARRAWPLDRVSAAGSRT